MTVHLDATVDVEAIAVQFKEFQIATDFLVHLVFDVNTLTAKEVDTLALSCFALTAELATRFLADYIEGDPYFKTNYPEHNLVRTRCQVALARDMQKKLDEMEKIVHDCVAAAKE